ncbi:MAG: cbb3-type cytochrome c oxidase subunit I [Chloroflexia bacterium]|jgi:heme/copper-type cytochrome/quinol oxidase subunit 1
MATITARGAMAGAVQAAGAPPETVSAEDADHGLARFFYAAAAALVLSAVQGVVQRLPGISDWLQDADYGGHMVTNLAYTHITIVGAGTISLTALIYYVLPRVTRRPLFSQALTNVSFWATIIGVFGFYVAMLSIGLYEGAMVHAGWGYEAARDWMGAWHKAPMAITAAIMGIGYWTFVTNVYVTVGRASGERKVFPEKAAPEQDFLLAKFFVVGATGLLFGTVQGVYQVMPWSLDWLHKTGEAGHLIDPMAHAHMNLVGGVSVALMGLMYFFLPRMLGKPVFSFKLAKVSFWCILIGVFGFYFTAVGLGWIEGTKILDGMTFDQAKDSVGIWHPLLLAMSAAIMGLGFWSFVANVLLTLRQKAASDAPVDRKLSAFIAFSVLAILLGTIQGVIQVLDPVEHWLEEAGPSGYLVTPLAHAQLNMVGFAIVALMAQSLFVLPRVLGRSITDPIGGRRALTVICAGIAASYAVFLGVGLLESITIHNGATPVAARQMVAGTWGRYALFIGAQALLGVGYILLFRYITRVIGRETIRAYWATFRGRMRGASQEAIRVHPRALPATPAQGQRKAISSALLEVVGLMGIGWLYSGRPFIGIMLLGAWISLLTIAYVILAIAGGATLLPALLGIFICLTLLSSISCYRSYVRDARAHLARAAVAGE